MGKSTTTQVPLPSPHLAQGMHAETARDRKDAYLIPHGIRAPTLELWQGFEQETAAAIIHAVQMWEYENRHASGGVTHTCGFSDRCTEKVAMRLLTRNLPGIPQGASVEASLRVAAAVKEYAHRACAHSDLKGTLLERGGKEYVDGEWRPKATVKGGDE